MTLEEFVEAHLAGKAVDVPDSLRAEFECAVAGHAAIEYALDETIVPAAGDHGDRSPPKLPADYEVIRELGRGGMGVVYLVQQKSLGRLVAVKVLRPGDATFGKIVRRFLEEAKHLARLRHENVVSVHEVGHAGDEPYFTMDYVDGRPLSAILSGQRLSPSRALAIWKQAAAGMQHAHALGIIHRDLKPGNILIDGAGRAYVTDFGLARDMTQSSQLTRTGEVMGTPAYMAPEQALGETDRIGEVTDVYALGVILYEMLTGVPPYGHDAPANVLVRLLKEEPVTPRRIDRRIPRDLETICLKGMAREPERRYATVTAFLEDIRRFEAGETVQARRPGFVYRTTRFLRRHGTLVTAIAGTAAVVLCLAFLIAAPSVEVLVLKGDNYHGRGEHRQALQVYRQALDRAWPFERLAVLERIARCAQETGDAATGVDAALSILQFDPDAWLGAYDYAVARAVLERKVSVQPRPPFGARESLSPAELAARRFRFFLNGPSGTSEERRVAELNLADICASLGKTSEETIEDIFPKWKLPEETIDESRQRAGDETRSLMERRHAAYASARRLESAGNRAGALDDYRRAFDLARQVHPVYFGAAGGMESVRPRSLQFEPKDSRLLRHIARTIRRLDADGSNLLRGGLRLRITGVDLPPELGLHLSLTLSDADSEMKHGAQGGARQSVPATSMEVPVQLDQSAWAGVADGRYRLTVQAGSRTGTSSGYLGSRGTQLFRMLELDFSALPAEVEVHGGTIDLPAIRAYLQEEIRLNEPAEGTALDFTAAVFRWNAIPGAQRYEVGFYVTRTDGSGTYLRPFLVVPIDGTPTLRSAELSRVEADKLQSLARGATGTWEVRAYDSQGRVVAKSPQPRNFVVGPSKSSP